VHLDFIGAAYRLVASPARLDGNSAQVAMRQQFPSASARMRTAALSVAYAP